MFLICLVTSTKLLFTKPVEQWRKITKRFFPTFLPIFFFFEGGGIKNWPYILKVNLAGLHLNRTDNLWPSTRIVLPAIKRSLWAYNVTYSPRVISPAERARAPCVTHDVFFVLASLCANPFPRNSVQPPRSRKITIPDPRRASKFSRKCATMLIHFEIVTARYAT